MPEPIWADLIRLNLQVNRAALAACLGGPTPRLVAVGVRHKIRPSHPRTTMADPGTYSLPDDVIASFSFEIDDAFGNKVAGDFGAATAATSDPALLSATLNPDGTLDIESPAGQLGTAQVTVTVPSTSGGPALTATQVVEVVAGAAAALKLVPGATRPRDTTAPTPTAPADPGTPTP